jgi:hypothetical protein
MVKTFVPLLSGHALYLLIVSILDRSNIKEYLPLDKCGSDNFRE